MDHDTNVEYQMECQSRTLVEIQETLESNGFQQETANLIEMMNAYRALGFGHEEMEIRTQIEKRMGLKPTVWVDNKP